MTLEIPAVTARLADLPHSRAVGKAVHARSRRCFRNALDGVLYLHGQGWRGLHYVEGWAISTASSSGLIWIAHAWIESATGAVIDPTPAYYRGAPADDYRTHQRFSVAEVRALIRAGRLTALPLSGDDLEQLNPALRNLRETADYAARRMDALDPRRVIRDRLDADAPPLRLEP